MPDTPLGMITPGMRFISWVPGRRGRDAPRLPAGGAQRHPPAADRRSLQRPGAHPAAGGDGRARRGSRRSCRADLLDQRRAHPRLLRRARGRARRLPRDGPDVPQGSRRPAHARRGARARRRRCWRRPASGRWSCTATARSGSRRWSTWRACRPASACVHTAVGAAVARHLAARGRLRRRATSRRRATRTRSTSSARRSSPTHFARDRPRQGAAGGRPARVRRRLLPPPAARAGWSPPPAGCSTELRRPELFDAVLEEVTRVRAEMGYPIIVTPVSQFIASQAARNVIDGERWRNVSDETVRYFLGHYGEPPAPVDPADRRPGAGSSPGGQARRACSRSAWRGPASGSARRISEEELLLRLTMPAEQVDAMIAARDAQRRRRARRGRSRRRARAARRSSRCCASSSGASPSRAPRSSPATTGWCGAVLDARAWRARVRVRHRRDAAAPRARRPGPPPAGGGRGARSASATSGRRLALFTNGSHVPSRADRRRAARRRPAGRRRRAASRPSTVPPATPGPPSRRSGAACSAPTAVREHMAARGVRAGRRRGRPGGVRRPPRRRSTWTTSIARPARSSPARRCSPAATSAATPAPTG